MRPLLEQAEQEDSRYLSFLGSLTQHGDGDALPRFGAELNSSTSTVVEALDALLGDLPEEVRRRRIALCLILIITAGADRERSHSGGTPVPPFAIELANLVDGLVGFLEAPVSEATARVIDGDPC